MSKPIEQVAALTIGTVESVSPSRIEVLLEPNAPQATALNTGIPSGFPRINGHLLIPNETGAVVGLIVGLGIERSAFPKRTGLKDFGLVDLPFPLRKIALTPLGTLVAIRDVSSGKNGYRLERGVSAFPSVGDPAQLPTAEQLKSIIESADPADRRVKIGTSPLAANAEVTIDPDKIFGRHLAVLGNTGSGKSCSVAGLIRWSLMNAQLTRERLLNEALNKISDGDSQESEATVLASLGGPVNARFIVLDPNGEYARAFEDYQGIRLFRVPPPGDGANSLVLPAWMWNSQEWSAFAQAAPGVQRPLLLRALREMRAGSRLQEPRERQALRLLRSYKAMIESRIAQGVVGYQGFPENRNFATQLLNMATDADSYAADVPGPMAEGLRQISGICRQLTSAHHWVGTRSDGYNDFGENEVRSIVTVLEATLSLFPDAAETNPVSEDAPIPFSISSFPDHLDQVAAGESGPQTAQLISNLTMRIRMLIADKRLGPVANPADPQIRFQQWLEDYVGSDRAANGELAIIDLSLIPSDVLHIVISVVARIIFEATQRYRKLNEKELPTVLVLEEAHTFIKRGSEDDKGIIATASQMCRETFECIAREGRKFGLGLVLSSQRPSELSATVLAQCNTFLLHRIVNDRDQELVGKLVPDNMGGLLKELPSLPSRQAILLGWAAPIPTLVEMLELPEEQRPRSNDPRFWDVWTGREDRRIDWSDIVSDWIGIAPDLQE